METLQELKGLIQEAEKSGNLILQADLLLRALEIAKKTCGLGSREQIELQSEYGGLLKYIGRHREAVEQLLQVKELLEPKKEKERQNYAVALVNLAGAYRFCQEMARSEALYLEARELLTEKDYLYASICNNLGILYQDQRRFEEAEKLHRESLALLRKKEEYQGEYAATLGNLASACLGLGKKEEADQMLKEALELLEGAGETDQPLYSSLINQKAVLCYKKGAFEQALQLFEKAYEICREKLGEESEACQGLQRNMEIVREALHEGIG